jgi:hypothetical protein
VEAVPTCCRSTVYYSMRVVHACLSTERRHYFALSMTISCMKHGSRGRVVLVSSLIYSWVMAVWLSSKWRNKLSGDARGLSTKLDATTSTKHRRMTHPRPAWDWRLQNSPQANTSEVRYVAKLVFSSGCRALLDPRFLDRSSFS